MHLAGLKASVYQTTKTLIVCSEPDNQYNYGNTKDILLITKGICTVGFFVRKYKTLFPGTIALV